ncbi:MAG: hypothetical protein FGM26_03220 [Beijerinckiaceae bacterium]|nr:hypothetical protein [Beijerinckiaceae bacterium]
MVMKVALADAWTRVPSVAAPLTAGPDETDIRQALAGIIAHPLFAKSIKLQRFLTYVVEETLAGRAERLKAYNIATVALGRADSFDPSQDPIVRVEASRLRRALTAYYAGEGIHDRVKIVLQAGSYQPVFEFSGTDEPPAHPIAQALTQGMTRRERILLGLILLLFLVVACNTAMLTLTVWKLDEMERAMGLTPVATSHFEVP